MCMIRYLRIVRFYGTSPVQLLGTLETLAAMLNGVSSVGPAVYSILCTAID
jgi:predicted sugar kinase